MSTELWCATLVSTDATEVISNIKFHDHNRGTWRFELEDRSIVTLATRNFQHVTVAPQ